MDAQDMRLEAALDELAALITRFTAAGDGSHTSPLRGLSFNRASAPTAWNHAVSCPGVGIIAQGVKRVMLGEEIYQYDRAHFLAGSIDLPVCGQVVNAAPDKPYLSLKLDLDAREVTELLLDDPAIAQRTSAPARGLLVSRVNLQVVEAFLRLLRLADTPQDIPALEGAMRREVLYRMMQTDLGPRLRDLVGNNGHSPRIAKTIDWLRKNFNKPLRVDELAALANMSASSFHEHFRAMTAMSPLQFQKQLRLQEARQLLMTGGALDAATAGHRVGYESPSQFSREYSRLFGAPPLRDTRRWREATAASVSA
jgi:AraC-like DNA-binding protein